MKSLPLFTVLAGQLISICNCYSPLISRRSPFANLQSRCINGRCSSSPNFALKSSISIENEVQQNIQPDSNAQLNDHDAYTTISMNTKANNKTLSPAAQWHQNRRQEMLSKYKSEILPLERDSSSNILAISLLALSNASLLGLSLLSGQLSIPNVILLSIFPGSMFSLWTLQILHDCLHGSLFPKKNSYNLLLGIKVKRKTLQNALLFWGSMPSAFGYYLYLKYGHLTHHKSLGDAESASLKTLFDSDRKEFEDGDVLFVAHRMKLKGEVGPRFQLGNNEIVMSISKSGFGLWREGKPLRNAVVFASSFLYERLMLMINDVVVAITGRNYFFPNKPKEFHDECALYCRCAVAIRALVWKLAGWKSLLFLYLSETLWSIPPHPACAMFVTNHGSTVDEKGGCTPSSSTYAGRWYSLFTLGTNYHVEHHVSLNLFYLEGNMILRLICYCDLSFRTSQQFHCIGLADLDRLLRNTIEVDQVITC